jgi:hypothetical protein
VGLLSNIRGRNQQINHLKLLFSTVYKNYIPLFFIFLLGYSIKVTQKAAADPEWNTLLGNIFMLQDVISLKPNVLSAFIWEMVYSVAVL